MRILIGCSGGLDSTYAARLLNENHEVCGIALKMNEYTDTQAAEESCHALGIPFVEVDVRYQFEKYVINNFVKEYARARTPNPCVICNRYVKIAALCDYAKIHGFDRIATGHYCGVNNINGRYCIVRGVDEQKDQSYMLWQLTQEQLAMLLTPLAKVNKSDISESAKKEGLKAAYRKESQDICFIPDGDYAAFIQKKVRTFPGGDFINKEGKVLGHHKGIINYTVGQRKGLGIALGEPMYVTKINVIDNTITLDSSDGGFTDSITVSSLVFQSLKPGEGNYEDLVVKIRYAAKPIQCQVEIKGDRAKVTFAIPQRAATPGQSAVFYKGDNIAFGGFID